MADIIKVKAKKSYEWNQDKKYVYVQIPLPAHTSLKKVEIYLSDLILRVTSTEKKQTHFLDLLKQIQFRSPDNKFVLSDGLLQATIRKATDEQWPSLLVEDISLAELKNRRRESEARYQLSGKQAEEVRDKLRVQYDRKATQELMRFEQQEREKLDQRKLLEKEQAVRQVFSGIDEKTGKIQKKEVKRLQVEREEEKWRKKERLALQILQKEEENERQGYSKQIKQKNESKIIEEVTKQFQKDKTTQETMFTQEQINNLQQMREKIGDVEEVIEEQEIPIRRGNNQKVAFTQRVYPNLAARDTFPQNKEPPMPKGKSTKAAAGDLQSKNPLWLKDKGDSFFRDKNYTAAVEAYSQAIKLQPKLTKAFLNRSLTFLKLFKLQDSINDCDQCLSLLQAELPSNEEQNQHSKITLAKIKARKAICLAWKGQLTSSKTLFKQINEMEFSEELKTEVASCLAQIQSRQSSLQHKLKGDELVKINNIPSALAQYERAILIDHNEYALSNKVLCLNKNKEFQQAISTAAQGIKKILRFNVGTAGAKGQKDSTLLLLKLHYRKAKAHEQMGQINEAQQQIRKGLTVNSEDQDMKQFLQVIKKKQSKQTLKQFKDSAVSLIREQKIKEALQIYGKCLKLLQDNQDVMQYLAILQNQCVCYQKLEKFDDVLSTCIRILKLVNSIQSKVLGFGGKKQQQADRDQLRKISVRTLMRRANAYVKSGQLYNAKSDFERALELNQDEQVKKELQRLYEKLKSELEG